MVNPSICLFCCIHPTVRLKICPWQQLCAIAMFPYQRYVYWDALTGCILANRPSAFPGMGQPECCIWGSSSCRQLSSACSYGDNSKSWSHKQGRRKKALRIIFKCVDLKGWGKKSTKPCSHFYTLFKIEIKLIATVGDFGQAPWFLDTEMLCSWLCGTVLYKQQRLNFNSTYEWILALLT